MDPRISAKIVQTNVVEWLEGHGVSHKLHWHAPVHNAREAAAAGLTFDPVILIKTLVYRTPPGWLLVALLRSQQCTCKSSDALTRGMIGNL